MRVQHLAAVTLGVGSAAILGLAGTPALQPFADEWRALLGFASLPVALGLMLAAVALWPRRQLDPLQLPWSRVLALELGVISALAVVHASSAPTSVHHVGRAGLIGWAAWTLAVHALGSGAAWLFWLAVACAALAIAAGVTAADLRRAFVRARDISAPTGARPLPGPGRSGTAARMDRTGQGSMPGPSLPARRESGLGRAADAASAGAVGARPGGIQGEAVKGAPRADQPAGAAGPRAGPRGARRPGRRPARRADYVAPTNILADDATGIRDQSRLEAAAQKIEQVLAAFGVSAAVVAVQAGPSVTRFGVRPGTYERAGRRLRVPVARITALKDDLALALRAQSIRIEAPVPGQPFVGLEIPNPHPEIVRLRGMLEDPEFRASSAQSALAIALGRGVTGDCIAPDLAAMPHLLVGGATGSGKSVFLHAIIASLLYQNTPDMLHLMLADPKRVEFGRYEGLPHLVGPVANELPSIVAALHWLAREMDARYRLFAEAHVRDRVAFNARSPAGKRPLPALVAVIDELADPMLTAPDRTEPALTRLAQLGRATGIHLVVATQRPSTAVITGVIKANFPARVAFAVAGNADSRVILDTLGAETLLGRGDMLFQAPDAVRPVRAQGTFVSDKEIAALVSFWRESAWPAPDQEEPWASMIEPLDPDERLYSAALELASREPGLNTSMLQRRLHIGYSKARLLMARLVDEGLAAEGSRGGDSGAPDPDMSID